MLSFVDGLQFVPLAYGKLTQVIARLPGGGHLSASLDVGVDAWRVGKGLARLATTAEP